MLGFAVLHRNSHFRGSLSEGGLAGFDIWQWNGQAGVDDFLSARKLWAEPPHWSVVLDLHQEPVVKYKLLRAALAKADSSSLIFDH